MIRRETWADRLPVDGVPEGAPARRSNLGATQAMAPVAVGAMIGWLARAVVAPAVCHMASCLPETLPPPPAWLLWACGIALALLCVAYQVALLVAAVKELRRLQD